LSESSIVYDYNRLKPFGRYQNPFWVTISREQEIQNQIARFYIEERDPTISEVTTVANALVKAYLSEGTPALRMVLVDLGATSTVVAILDHDQGVYATSFPIGGESFTGAVASLKKCPFEEAESLKRSQDLFTGPNELSGFMAVVDIWQKDLAKILREWEEDNPEIKSPRQAFRIRLSGGGALQMGLRQYLENHSNFVIESWPANAAAKANFSIERCAAAYGAALQSFRKKHRFASLLPPDRRVLKKRQQQLMALNWAGLSLLAVLALLLLVGTGQKLVLAYEKNSLVTDAKLALRRAQDVEALIQQRELDYGNILPLLDSEKITFDTLDTLKILQRMREKKNLWFLLLSDQKSYFAGAAYTPPGLIQTNPPSAIETTNHVDARAGFIAQLCLPDKGGDPLKMLNDLVTDLKKEDLFDNVDVLPASLIRTNLVDPKLVPPDRNFTLSIELAQKEVPRPMLHSEKSTNAPAPARPKGSNVQ
ncbi:MAG: cell division FtsA domain-containing protein, partial [Candidatus Omnitrophica bacterium]|nr:cell division FtsA domain-containing protein [Candidatus Omnitrophota bacterium]